MYKVLNLNYSELPKEDVEQKALIKYLRKEGYFVYAATNENNTYKQNRKYAMIAEIKAEANGKLKGVADITLFTKDKIIFIELKRQRPILKNGNIGTPKNKPTKEQIDFICKVNEFDYCYGFFAYGCNDAIKILKELE